MNKYIVKNCPAYDRYIMECKCEDTPHICCHGNTSYNCPIKQMIDYLIENKSKDTQEILEIFEVAEVEE